MRKTNLKEFTANQLAHVVGVTKGTVGVWCRDGRLKGRIEKRGGTRLLVIRAEDFEAFAAEYPADKIPNGWIGLADACALVRKHRTKVERLGEAGAGKMLRPSVGSRKLWFFDPVKLVELAKTALLGQVTVEPAPENEVWAFLRPVPVSGVKVEAHHAAALPERRAKLAASGAVVFGRKVAA